jgi:hypothetical protein
MLPEAELGPRHEFQVELERLVWPEPAIHLIEPNWRKALQSRPLVAACVEILGLNTWCADRALIGPGQLGRAWL